MADQRKYRAAMWARAKGGTEIKWLRNITITLLAGIGVALFRGGPVIATLLWTWLFAALLFVGWESVAFVYRRFYIAPFEDHQRLSGEVARLESELTVTTAERMSKAKRKELATRISQQSEFAVHNFWAKRPHNDDDEAKWIAAIRKWHDETLEIMKTGGCTEPEIMSVRVLGNLTQFNPTGRRYAARGTVNQWLTMVEGYRQRLEPIIRRYDAD